MANNVVTFAFTSTNPLASGGIASAAAVSRIAQAVCKELNRICQYDNGGDEFTPASQPPTNSLPFKITTLTVT
jgi:hypothetical protein